MSETYFQLHQNDSQFSTSSPPDEAYPLYFNKSPTEITLSYIFQFHISTTFQPVPQIPNQVIRTCPTMNRLTEEGLLIPVVISSQFIQDCLFQYFERTLLGSCKNALRQDHEGIHYITKRNHHQDLNLNNEQRSCYLSCRSASLHFRIRFFREEESSFSRLKTPFEVLVKKEGIFQGSCGLILNGRKIAEGKWARFGWVILVDDCRWTSLQDQLVLILLQLIQIECSILPCIGHSLKGVVLTSFQSPLLKFRENYGYKSCNEALHGKRFSVEPFHLLCKIKESVHFVDVSILLLFRHDDLPNAQSFRSIKLYIYVLQVFEDD
ncbi:hypothetical protein CEXT_674381 [Caerostris extrusa]|uniref:Uncharacterized protein n=1 Tax=Caerostris extrusa TaxID=172846 RepID=A0AAV4QZW7_CAEEX|nr:hypothetical protein CEXT_674381 [Caerostris extrusa]